MKRIIQDFIALMLLYIGVMLSYNIFFWLSITLCCILAFHISFTIMCVMYDEELRKFLKTNK